MKRSEINTIIENAIEFFNSHQFKLPPFGYYTLDDWRAKKDQLSEIADLGLGWDITDFGANDFHNKGLVLFTLRNGKLNSSKYPKNYAEKIMVVEEEQFTPMHFHWNKMEDIINRAGGNLLIKVYNATKDEDLDQNDLRVNIDGFTSTVKAGTVVSLKPGESISLPPYLYHSFYGEKGKGKIMVGEVSMVNDDDEDNRFHQEIARFPEIEEDVDPTYLLCKDYQKFVLK